MIMGKREDVDKILLYFKGILIKIKDEIDNELENIAIAGDTG